MSNLRIAIVYDWIDKWGGVERVLLELHRLFPRAIYYASYLDTKSAPWAQDLIIKTTFIQELPAFIKKKRLYSLPFYPYAFESLEFGDFDVVLSVTSSFAKAVITKPGIAHICYLLTPPRFLWSHDTTYIKSPLLRRLISPLTDSLKKWDKISAQRPDHIYSISETVKQRCGRFYGRKSKVLYPPFNSNYWTSLNPERPKMPLPDNFFLVVSRLEPYKRVDLVLQAFNQLSLSLVIVGKGLEEKKLKSIASANTLFLGSLTDEELAYVYKRAQALIMPQEEDFGLTALEALIMGCPVISYGRGGVTEIIKEGKTGIFFRQQTPFSIISALERFHTISYNLKRTVKSTAQDTARKFEAESFTGKMRQIIEGAAREVRNY